MPIYTAEIAGRPILVFAATDEAVALAFANDGFIRSELSSLRTPEGAPLWDGAAAITIRDADTDEREVWERNLVLDLAEGVHESREDAIRSNGFAFLADCREPDE